MDKVIVDPQCWRFWARFWGVGVGCHCWLLACTMNVSRLPTSQIIYSGHGHQAPPHTHITTQRGKKNMAESQTAMRLDFVPLRRLSWWVRASFSLFSPFRRRLSSSRVFFSFFFFSISIYKYMSSRVYRLRHSGGATQFSSSHSSLREINIYIYQKLSSLNSRPKNKSRAQAWLNLFCSPPFSLFSFSLRIFCWWPPKRTKPRRGIWANISFIPAFSLFSALLFLLLLLLLPLMFAPMDSRRAVESRQLLTLCSLHEKWCHRYLTKSPAAT